MPETQEGEAYEAQEQELAGAEAGVASAEAAAAERLPWARLSDVQQQAAEALGWSQSSWDARRGASQPLESLPGGLRQCAETLGVAQYKSCGIAPAISPPVSGGSWASRVKKTAAVEAAAGVVSATTAGAAAKKEGE